MNLRTLSRTLALSLPLVFGLSACAGIQKMTSSVSSVFGGKDKGGLSQADDLLTRIERVHIESEVARETIRSSVGTLRAFVSPEFKGDPEKSYDEFVKSVEESVKRAKVLRSSFEAMRKSAEPYFNQWAADLESFNSTEMRVRSQSRLLETRERYDDIVKAVSPALVEFDAFNANLNDHALFLGNDFNAGAVATIQPEVKSLTKRAIALDRQFVGCMQAARTYVESASPMTSFGASGAAPESKVRE